MLVLHQFFQPLLVSVHLRLGQAGTRILAYRAAEWNAVIIGDGLGGIAVEGDELRTVPGCAVETAIVVIDRLRPWNEELIKDEARDKEGTEGRKEVNISVGRDYITQRRNCEGPN